jgi:hypothetical protein
MLPLQARTLINKRFTYISLMIIFGCSLLSIVPLYASLIKKTKCTRGERQQYISYEAFDMQVNSELMAKFYVPAIQTISFYLPWLIALILWILLLRSLRKSERDFQTSMRDASSKQSWKNNHVSLSNFGSLIFDTNLVDNIDENNNDQSRVRLNQKNNLNGNNNKLQKSNSLASKSENVVRINSSPKTKRSNLIQYEQTNSFNRTNSYNKITLMVVVLCLSHLICRLFTFVFIFEVIFNEYIKTSGMNEINYQENESIRDNSSSWLTFDSNDADANNSTNHSGYFKLNENARTQFPKFMAYSLLLNNIFLCINHSFNIFIYAFTNPRFKKNLNRLFTNCDYLCKLFK